MSSITEVIEKINAGIPIADAIPIGADVGYWQRMINNHTTSKSTPRRKKRRTPQRRRTRRTFRADAVLARSSYTTQQTQQNQASSQLVERVNKEPAKAEVREIIWFVNGQTRILEVV